MHSAFAANAGESRSAKRRSQITQEPAIHPRDTHVHSLRNAMASLQVAGPDRCGESILRIIGHRHGFLFQIKRRDVANGPEDFLFHAPRRFRKSSIEGWLHVETVVAIVAKLRNSSATDQRRSFFPGQLVVRKHFLSMLP